MPGADVIDVRCWRRRHRWRCVGARRVMRERAEAGWDPEAAADVRPGLRVACTRCWVTWPLDLKEAA
jgi:hypothetical protein